MPRPRTRPDHPYIAELKDRFKASDLMELSQRSRIPYTSLMELANRQVGSHRQYEALIRDAVRSAPKGTKPEKAIIQFMLGMLGKESISEVLEEVERREQQAS